MLRKVISVLDGDSQVLSSAARVYHFGMLSSSYNSSSVQVIGVDYKHEKNVSSIETDSGNKKFPE